MTHVIIDEMPHIPNEALGRTQIPKCSCTHDLKDSSHLGFLHVVHLFVNGILTIERTDSNYPENFHITVLSDA